jgi:hypothetical protein
MCRKVGLSTLKDLPKLGKLTMKCKVDDLSPRGVGGFLQLMEWVVVYFTFSGEIEDVRKRKVEFDGLVAVVLTVGRKDGVKK